MDRETEAMKKEIGKRIQQFRQTKGYTQERLAELVGTSITTISRIETGEQMCGVFKLMRIAEVLDVGTDAILFEPRQTEFETEEYHGQFVCLLEEVEKCSSESRKYLWEMLTGFLKLQRNHDQK